MVVQTTRLTPVPVPEVVLATFATALRIQSAYATTIPKRIKEDVDFYGKPKVKRILRRLEEHRKNG
jgi:hypothetical protein